MVKPDTSRLNLTTVITLLGSLFFFVSNSLAATRLVTISKAQFGDHWVFSRNEVQLRCTKSGSLLVINPNTLAQYPLNDIAREQMKVGEITGEPLERILLVDSLQPKKDLSPFINQAQRLCWSEQVSENKLTSGQGAVEMKNRLAELRTQIDEVDRGILQLLAQRVHLVTQIGQIKTEYDVPIFDPEREEQIISLRTREAVDLGVSPEFIRDIWQSMMKESRRLQLFLRDSDSESHSQPDAEK